MNIEFFKGLVLLLAVIAAVLALVVTLSDAGPAKAVCVMHAFASHISIVNIDEVCKLTSRAR
jgi:hypothetical protein